MASNPFRSVSPPTWAGGSNPNAIAAMQNPVVGATPLGRGRTRVIAGAGGFNSSMGGGRGGFQQPQAFSNTGGPGAAPALPGRIGYRGQLGAAPDLGVQQLAKWRQQDATNAGAKNEMDITGLPVNASPAQINELLTRIGGQGDDATLGQHGVGLGGSQRTAALSNYYNARASGDPAKIAAASATIEGLKTSIQKARTLASQDQQNQAAPAVGNAATGAATNAGLPQHINPTTPGQSPAPKYDPTNPTPVASSAGSGLGGSQGTGVPGIPITGASTPGDTSGQSDQAGLDAAADNPAPTPPAALKKGGPEAAVHPYEVNEKGTEAVKYDGTPMPQMIPGGDHVTTFPQSGRVIPHGRTMQLMKQGKVAMPEHRAEGGVEVPTYAPDPTPWGSSPSVWSPLHDLVRGAQSGVGPLEATGILPERSPVANLERGAMRLGTRGLSAIASPFRSAPTPLPQFYAPTSPADLKRGELYGAAPTNLPAPLPPVAAPPAPTQFPSFLNDNHHRGL